MNRIRLTRSPAATLGLAVAISSAFIIPALGHPHVWVTAKAQLIFTPDAATAIRHSWTFDPAYSAYAMQGLDKNGDGKFTPDELLEFAKVTAESLSDFDYFTLLKANGTKQAFDPPRDTVWFTKTARSRSVSSCR
jgi:ABC-type uncharacterized transport system substrate-binding protein